VQRSKTWLNAQVAWLMPEQELLSMAPGQPPLSRWIAQMEISGGRAAQRAHAILIARRQYGER